MLELDKQEVGFLLMLIEKRAIANNLKIVDLLKKGDRNEINTHLEMTMHEGSIMKYLSRKLENLESEEFVE